MTKKDFELIARTIKALSPNIVTKEQRDLIAEVFAVALSTTNDRFKPKKFKDACK